MTDIKTQAEWLQKEAQRHSQSATDLEFTSRRRARFQHRAKKLRQAADSLESLSAENVELKEELKKHELARVVEGEMFKDVKAEITKLRADLAITDDLHKTISEQLDTIIKLRAVYEAVNKMYSYNLPLNGQQAIETVEDKP